MQQHCHEDLAVLLSSGFDAQKEPQPAGVLLAPQGAALTQGTLADSALHRAPPAFPPTLRSK